jgi:hypothetical protein
MAIKWITKKGKDGENRHIPISQGNKRREKELDIKIKPKYKGTIENMNNTTRTLYELGLITDKGELNITEKELNDFFYSIPNDGRIYNLIEVNNDKIKLLSYDGYKVMSIKKIIPNNTHLENGKYELYYDRSDNSFKLKKIEPNDTRILPKELNYKYDDGIDLHIDGEKYKKIRTILNNLDKENDYFTIVIQKDKDSDKVKMKFYKNLYKPKSYIAEVEFYTPEEKDKEIFSKVGAESFDTVLTMLNGKSKQGSINLNLKTDYPLIFHKEDSNKKEYGYLATLIA